MPRRQAGFGESHDWAVGTRQTIRERLLSSAVNPERLGRPQRCRALLFDPDGERILVIGRARPGREPYVVFPGGGLDDTDLTPRDGIRRELQEELGLRDADYELDDLVIPHNDQYYFIGRLHAGVETFVVGGPEATRDPAISGTYSPQLLPLRDLVSCRAYPEEITALIAVAVKLA